MKENFILSEVALVIIDYINDIVSEGGKLSGKGYTAFIESHSVSDHVSELLKRARVASIPVIHVRVGFSTGYLDHPGGSPLFGGAKKFEALSLDQWGTDFAAYAAPAKGELIVTKHRVSAFYGTDLELALRSMGIRQIVFAGCATDLAVQSAVRDAHDRDFEVYVAVDACAAATEEDHANSLPTLGKIAHLLNVGQLTF